MYTQCPDCETVFHVTADQLSVASGDVNCGACGATFNALFSLTDDLPGPRPVDETRAYGEAQDAIRSGESLFDAQTANRSEWLDLLTEVKGNEPDQEKTETKPEISHETYFDSTHVEVADTEDSPETHDLPPWLGNGRQSTPVSNSAPEKTSRHRLIAGVALSIILAGQLLHYNRDTVATHPVYGNIARGFYGLLGSTLYPEWPLGAFEVRGTEAVAGRTSASALDILAKVLVVSDQPVGMPLVRIVLRDRWSNPVASRIFQPVEYLANNYDRTRTVDPGTTLPIEISVADPGIEARGYVVDICLPRRKIGLQCQLARDPFQ